MRSLASGAAVDQPVDRGAEVDRLLDLERLLPEHVGATVRALGDLEQRRAYLVRERGR